VATSPANPSSSIFFRRARILFYDRATVYALKKDDEIVLLALGDVKYDVLSYLNKRKDIEIVKLETRFMKKREKATGVKVTVRRRMQAEPLQK
jgi:hypothetical protein